ncbi:MAG: aspartate kinase [Deltaproteobacteria bacterium]|nr:aspartate kinase [Deltaproteobacteria bacterium]
MTAQSTPSLPPIVVQKYGGSSVASVDKLRHVAKRVVGTALMGKRVCVVVSAMGDTTDELLALAKKVSAAPTRRELDMLLSCGERISMALLSMAIAELGHEAISFTGSQSGIMTNDRHSGARIIEVRPVRIQDELDRGKIVIVAGFQGVSYKREITTLGRGGSDTTAVALAAALGAEYCEICSDVDGVYSGDPRVVAAPRLLRDVSYDEMQELAEHGAKVLNAQAVELARQAKIAIYARGTEKAPGAGGGTRVGAQSGVETRRGAVGVTGLRDLTRVGVRGQDGGRELLALLCAETVPVVRIASGEEGALALFMRENIPDWAKVKARLLSALEPHGVTCEEDLAAASVVGEGIGTSADGLARALEVARKEGQAVLGFDSSPLRLTLCVAPASLDTLVRALHREFIQ